jgi:hypothetical protein
MKVHYCVHNTPANGSFYQPHEFSTYLSSTPWQQKLTKVIAKNMQINDGHLNCGSFTQYTGHLIQVPKH